MQDSCSVDVLQPRTPSASRAARGSKEAFRACVEQPPRMLGTSRIAGYDVHGAPAHAARRQAEPGPARAGRARAAFDLLGRAARSPRIDAGGRPRFRPGPRAIAAAFWSARFALAGIHGGRVPGAVPPGVRRNYGLSTLFGFCGSAAPLHALAVGRATRAHHGAERAVFLRWRAIGSNDNWFTSSENFPDRAPLVDLACGSVKVAKSTPRRGIPGDRSVSMGVVRSVDEQLWLRKVHAKGPCARRAVRVMPQKVLGLWRRLREPDSGLERARAWPPFFRTRSGAPLWNGCGGERDLTLAAVSEPQMMPSARGQAERRIRPGKSLAGPSLAAPDEHHELVGSC